jgi:hypothetical protein
MRKPSDGDGSQRPKTVTGDPLLQSKEEAARKVEYYQLLTRGSVAAEETLVAMIQAEGCERLTSNPSAIKLRLNFETIFGPHQVDVELPVASEIVNTQIEDVTIAMQSFAERPQ